MTTKRNRTSTAPRRRDSLGLSTELRNLARHARASITEDAAGPGYWNRKARAYERWARWVAAVLDAGRKGERT
jgi:hypothetical protein